MTLTFAAIFAALFVIGAILSSLANWFVDCFCWTPRFRSPWRAMPSEFLERIAPFSKTGLDFVPIIGWLFLRRLGTSLEKIPAQDRLPGLETRDFWLRPFFVELLAALGTVGLFEWEVHQRMILPEGVMQEPLMTVVLRFSVHVLLFTFLLAATLTDFDDMIIPDNLTGYGTILGLTLALWLPQQMMLPATECRTEIVLAPLSFGMTPAGQNPTVNHDVRFTISPKSVPLNMYSPNPNRLYDEKGTKMTVKSVLVMWGLWTFWCFAMMDRIWYRKLPFRKAAAIFCRYLKRSPRTGHYIKIAIIAPLTLLIPVLFSSLGEHNDFSVLAPMYAGLFSSLVGMATGMCLIWGARLIAGGVLRREAMGFGDVTLMGMIGAFLGWQSCILIFFLAPLAGLVFGIVHLVMGHSREIPYGPFLCLASVGVVIFWNPIWTYTEPMFELGGLTIGIVMFICLVMLGVLLSIWLWIRNRIFGI